MYALEMDISRVASTVCFFGERNSLLPYIDEKKLYLCHMYIYIYFIYKIYVFI